MNKQQLKQILEKLNRQIDMLIIEGKNYSKLAHKHTIIVKLLNQA